jgi:hypothetical protein
MNSKGGQKICPPLLCINHNSIADSPRARTRDFTFKGVFRIYNNKEEVADFSQRLLHTAFIHMSR